jgi:hypothetical protein
MNTQEISDRIELKELVDLFSNYSDTKENDKQVALFTEDGVVNIINDGKISFTLNGRKEIFNAFSFINGRIFSRISHEWSTNR